MGNPPAGNASYSYRDDPDDVSLHTTRDDYEYDDAPEPPAYSDATASRTSTESTPFAIPDQYPQYAIIAEPRAGLKLGQSAPGCVSVGSKTNIVLEPRLMDADALHYFLDKIHCVIPPRPALRLQGSHREEQQQRDGKKTCATVTDFDIVFSLQSLLPVATNPDLCERQVAGDSSRVYRGSIRKLQAPGRAQPDVESDADRAGGPDHLLLDWCRDFANSKAPVRVFRLSRSVSGLDGDGLTRHLTALVRATDYRGHITVTFPMADANLDVYSPHWVNRARVSWVRWLFYLSFLWIFTWPLLLLLTKWWTVVHVEWRVSVPVEGGARRRHAVRSELDWFRHHEKLIRSLVLDRYQGDATDLPTDVAPSAAPTPGANGRLPQTGNRNVDAAVDFIQNGVDTWNSIARGGNTRGGNRGWGADT